jgi:hypothetical protein
MKTSRQIRYENARSLAVDGPADFARKLSDVSEKPVSNQQVNSIIGPNASRGIGDDIARRIEQAYEKEEGWLDHEWDDKAGISEANSPLSDEAKSLILCVERLDGTGDLARKTFTLHQGLLLLSSAAAELQTGFVRSQMLADLEHQLGPTQSEFPGVPSERKHKK